MFELSRPWPFGLSRRTALPALAGLILVLFALWWADAPLSRAAQSLPEPVVGFFNWITDYGQSDWILYPSLIFWLVCTVLARFGNKRTANLALKQMAGIFGFIFLAVGLPGLVSNLSKSAIGRARPRLLDTVGSLDFHPIFNNFTYESFPSGHATTAMAFCFVMTFLSPRLLPVMLVFSGAIALSRVVVGAHYPTDVLGGIVLGTLGAYLVRNLFATRRWVFERAPSGDIVQRPPAAVLRLIRGRRPAKR